MINPDLLISLLSGLSITIIFSLTVSRKFNRCKSARMPRLIRKMEQQLPLFLDFTSSSLSAGNSLQQSLELAIQKDQTALGSFFGLILQRAKSGMTLDMSLELEAAALKSGSLSLALLGMASAYRSGSNLVESLSILSEMCREREILRKKILARTAQSRAQGIVLTLVPILFMGMLYIVSPQNMIPVLLTGSGRKLLAAAVVLQVLGGFTIHRLLKQEIV